jgi:hypothetical protein
VKRLAGLVLVVSSVACSSFLHFNDPTAQAVTCAITSLLMPELEAIVVATGIPLSVVEALYGDACNAAAARGLTQEQAQREALSATRGTAMKLSKMGAKFPGAAK